jgi:WD40 repeat protein
LLSLVLIFPSGFTVRAQRAKQGSPHTDRYGDPLPEGAILRLKITRSPHGDAKTAKRSPGILFNHSACFSLTPSGTELIVGHRSGQIEVWDVASGRVLRQLAKADEKGHALVCLAVSPDGREVAAGRGHCDIRLFRTKDGEEGRPLACPLRLDGGWMKFLAWSPDGKCLFADGSGMIICRLNADTGKEVWAVGDENMPWFALSPEGRFLAKGLWDGLLFLDASTGRETSTVRLAMTHEQGPVGPIAWAPDGKHLALAIDGGAVVICDRAGLELRRFAAVEPNPRLAKVATGGPTPEAHDRRAALAFTPDGKWIVSGGADTSVQVWEVATGKAIARFNGHESTVKQVAVAPDGRSAFSAGEDGCICQWDLRPKLNARLGHRPDALWAAAAAAEPASAVAAAWALVTRSDEDRAYLAGKLSPFAAAADEEVIKWIADMDAPAFADRERAMKVLAAQGPTVERQLRQTLERPPSAEVERRTEKLLARLGHSYTADELRALRLVQACELSGKPDARSILERWAGGAPNAVLTEDAKAALARLDRRRGK